MNRIFWFGFVLVKNWFGFGSTSNIYLVIRSDSMLTPNYNRVQDFKST